MLTNLQEINNKESKKIFDSILIYGPSLSGLNA